MLPVVLNLGEPGRGIDANPVEKGEQVFCCPLLDDFSVRQAIDVDRIPAGTSPRRGDIYRSLLRVRKALESNVQWAIVIAAFLASAVEFVEAFTLVLVAGITTNWRSAILGALWAAAILAVIVRHAGGGAGHLCTY